MTGMEAMAVCKVREGQGVIGHTGPLKATVAREEHWRVTEMSLKCHSRHYSKPSSPYLLVPWGLGAGAGGRGG